MTPADRIAQLEAELAKARALQGETFVRLRRTEDEMVARGRDLKASLALNAKLVEALTSIQWVNMHACVTGDCPHATVFECAKVLIAEMERIAAEAKAALDAAGKAGAPCPECQGKGTKTAIAAPGRPFVKEQHTCGACHGTGRKE